MLTKKQQFERVHQIWDKLLEMQSLELEPKLTELDMSSLSACIGDCFESFWEIYFGKLLKIGKAGERDYSRLHGCVTDIYWEFDHIKNHIIDAEKGFVMLMDLLAKKADNQQKE